VRLSYLLTRISRAKRAALPATEGKPEMMDNMVEPGGPASHGAGPAASFSQRLMLPADRAEGACVAVTTLSSFE
jgi:hypothetical protein